ncbi:hypothetical protein [Streptomyces rochei]|uniref:hypothetical protein n=1 Tax=Streptomyces rochei TaxID=1928 RepID=UPI0036A1E45D
MTEATEPDKTQVYLVPVAHLELADEPEYVHLSLYSWNERTDAWLTQTGICGRSTTQGALPEGTEVTCPGCLKWRPAYDQTVAGHNHRRELESEARRQQAMAEDTTENGAWHTVWLESKWRWITSRMTTPQREYAADCVAAYSRYLATCDGELERDEPEGLRWWRADQ